MKKNKIVELFLIYGSPISELMGFKDITKKTIIYIYKIDTGYLYALTCELDEPCFEHVATVTVCHVDEECVHKWAVKNLTSYGYDDDGYVEMPKEDVHTWALENLVRYGYCRDGHDGGYFWNEKTENPISKFAKKIIGKFSGRKNVFNKLKH